MTASRDSSEWEAKRARRTNRRLRALLAGVAVLLVAAVAGGILALVQRGEARDAETARLTQRLGAQAFADEDLDRSLLLARQAVEIADTPRSRGYLLAGAHAAPRVVGVMHGPDGSALWGVAIGPDGRTLVASDFYDRMIFFDAHAYARIGKPLQLGPGSTASRSPRAERRSPTVPAATSGASTCARARSRRRRSRGRRAPCLHRGRVAARRHDRRPHDVRPGHGDAEARRHPDPTRRLPTFRHPVVLRPPHFALTPDGHAVVRASDDGELAWWDLTGSRRPLRSRSRRATRGGAQPGRSPRPSASSAASARRPAYRGDADGPRRVIRTPNWLLFSPDGRALVSTNEDETVSIWDAASLASGQILRGHSNGVQQPVFSPDGNTLYRRAATGRWSPGTHGRPHHRRPFSFTHDHEFNRGYDGNPGRFRPDGRLIAVGLKEDGVTLLDARDLAPVGERLVGPRRGQGPGVRP